MTQPLRLDGYESALIGPRRFDMAYAVQDAGLLYARGGLYGRVIDMPADKAVARGVEIKGDDGCMQDELDRLKVMPALADGLRWARLTGGAGIVIVADDGKVNQPLNPGAVDEIAELRVFDLNDISADERRYNDPTQANFGMPEFYRIHTGGAIFTVHESRLIEIPGDPLPAKARLRGIPWEGRSVATQAFPAITRYLEALRLSVSILHRKQQAVYGMKGLADMIANDMESVVQRRISLVDKVRGVLNTVAIDSEDEYDVKDMNLSGVKDVIQELQVGLSVEIGIPVTIVFGRSPGGLNATGDADFDGYHEMVSGLQTRATPALERIVSLIYAQRSYSKPPDSWTINWPPLRMPTEKELADVRKTNADADAQEMKSLETAVGLGAVSEEEAREYLVELERYGLKPEEGPDDSARYANQT
jgi:phage-related protein (TIGR01555 family)